MPEYEIERWDPVLTNNNNEPFPMVYIKPSPDFLNYMIENNYLFLLTLSDTESQYDEKQVLGMSDMSAFYPNYRPNFFNDTGYYTITLFCNWIGYPPKNGKIRVQGLKGPDAVVPQTVPYKAPHPLPVEYYKPSQVVKKEDDNINGFSFYGLGFILIVVLCLLFFLMYRDKNKNN